MKISELFTSIQGEGPNIGVPSTFIRLAGCNLRCKWCDTKYAWSEGKNISIDKIIKYIERQGLKHVVITGGEPLLQKEDLEILCWELLFRYDIEIETNGTQEPLDVPVSLYSISPKLSNSGVPAKDRKLKPFPYDNSVYKFVMSKPSDISEVLQIQKEWQISPTKIFLMPEGATKRELQKKREWVIELCKEFGFRFSPRLQIEYWGRKRGV